MNFYFVGLTMGSPTHDYADLRRVLALLGARQVSHRVWMSPVREAESGAVFARVRQCLAPDDEMIVEEVPGNMRPPKAAERAA